MIALIMLFAVAYSSAESVIGVLRDGAVHHESMAAAAAHASSTAGEHSHHDEGKSSDRSQHEHGDSSDHCTHQHGTPLTAPLMAIAAAVEAHFEPAREPVAWFGRDTQPILHPPQA